MIQKGLAGKGNKSLSQQSSIDVGRKMIHRIMAEEEMSSVHTLAIVLNCRQGTDIYEQIYNDKDLIGPEIMYADKGKVGEDEA